MTTNPQRKVTMRKKVRVIRIRVGPKLYAFLWRFTVLSGGVAIGAIVLYTIHKDTAILGALGLARFFEIMGEALADAGIEAGE